jgi:hypothetical protein
MTQRQAQSEFTESERLSVKLKDGTVVSGTLWLHASRRGGFVVEYQGIRHSDYRNDYTSENDLKGAARMMLREVAEKG